MLRKPKTDRTARAEEIGLHNLKPKPGSRASAQADRPRRGQRPGKTSGRGHKGAGSRSGRKEKAGYEGGQNPITCGCESFAART